MGYFQNVTINNVVMCLHLLHLLLGISKTELGDAMVLPLE